MSNAEKPAFPQRYGKYELLERVGEGGMAEVFRARLPGAAGFEKILVLKRILPHLAKKPDFVKMFVDEAKLAAKVQHQNVVQVFELGEVEGGELYMAMEYVSGVDLRRLLLNARDRRLQIPVWFALHTVAEVLSGLAYAHELVDAGGHPLCIVHRDVTPGNIFISYQGEVKLADFGIAKAVGRVSETEAGQVKGNAPFMAPEAIYGRALDARADVFSAGVVLWACLALRLPFEGSSNYETAKLVCEAPREPPSRYNSLVGPDLDVVALQALEVHRDRRISSAREFQAKLLEILARLRPKLLPSDVRNVVEVLCGRHPPDAQFAQAPPTAALRPAVVHSPAAVGRDVTVATIEAAAWVGSPAPAGVSPGLPPVVAGKMVVPRVLGRSTHDEEGSLLEIKAADLLPDEPLDLPRNEAGAPRPVPTAPLVVAGSPGRDDASLVVQSVPLASIMDFMHETKAPVTEAPRDGEKYYNDSNKFSVRHQDGTVVVAHGLDECLRLCDPHSRQAVQISIDGVNWLDLPAFARLSGLDYLAPDSTPLRNVTMVGMIEERSLLSVFVQLARTRASGKLVVMDKGMQRVARREVDIVGGAPVHVYTDHPTLQAPHLYVQHDLIKKELVPALVVQIIRQRQPLEEVARRQMVIDLNPYRNVLMRDRLAEIFSWRYGKFAFDAGREAKGGPPFAPSLLRILPDAVQRGYAPQELRRDLEPYMNVRMRRTDAFDATLQELGLKDKHAAAARRLGQRTTLAQALKKAPGESHIQLVMAFILVELGAIAVG